MNLKQRKIKFKPRIKLNHNIYNQTFGLNSAQNPGVIHQGCNPTSISIILQMILNLIQ